MYKSDSPIQIPSQDLLRRKDFALGLAKSLISYNDKASLSVGLLGPWGSGKTSLVNLIIDDVEKKSQGMSGDSQPIILRFNPWNFTSSDQLLHQFFLMLADQFTGKKDEALGKIGDALKKYGSAFDAFNPFVALLKYGTAIGQATSVISDTSKASGDVLKSLSLHEATDLSSQRKKIIDLLDKQKRKVIITIDDIDRLNNTEIQLIFKLVASVANFPNTIFLLSFDKDIVVSALNNYQGDDGNKYLDKIIQVVVNIPPVSESQLRDVFDNYFDPLKKQYKQMVWNPAYWNLVSPHVFSMIETVRDVVRLYNTIQLKLSMIGDEINLSDLILITTIELKSPKFFEWIRNNKSELVNKSDGFLAGLFGIKDTAEQWEKRYKQELKDAHLSMDIAECQEILSLLFPVYAARIHAYNYYSNDTESLIRDQRIGYQDKFDRYFVLSLDDEQIPREILKNAVENLAAVELELFIKKAVSKYNGSNVITEIDALAPALSDTRSKVLLIAMLKCIKYFENTSAELYYSSAKRRAEDLCLTLMEKIGKESSFEVITEAIDNAEPADLVGIAYLLDIMLISYNRIRENHGYPQVVSEDQLNDILQSYLSKFFELDSKNNLLELENPQIYWIIQFFDKDKYNDFIQNKVNANDLNRLMFLADTVSLVYGSGGNYYQSVDKEERAKFLTDEEITSAINTCVNDKSINELSLNQAIRVAAYALRDSSYDRDVGVPEKNCLKKLDEWKYEKAQ